LARADGNENQGWTLTQQTLTFPLTQHNACNGDTIEMTGEGTLTTRTKVQPNGTVSIKTSATISATGIGTPSGAEYTLRDESVSSADGVGTLPFSLFVNRSAKLIAAGQPDMYLHAVVHVKIDIDGNVTHDLVNLTTNCNP